MGFNNADAAKALRDGTQIHVGRSVVRDRTGLQVKGNSGKTAERMDSGSERPGACREDCLTEVRSDECEHGSESKSEGGREREREGKASEALPSVESHL